MIIIVWFLFSLLCFCFCCVPRCTGGTPIYWGTPVYPWSPWAPMDFHGCPWNSWSPMDLHGYPWHPCMGYPRNPLVHVESTWIPSGMHYITQANLNFQYFQQSIMAPNLPQREAPGGIWECLPMQYRMPIWVRPMYTHTCTSIYINIYIYIYI